MDDTTLTGYPPPVHVLGDLGIEAVVDGQAEVRVRSRVTPEVAGADGGVRLGVLATLVDVVGGAVAARVLHPDWMATADLSIASTGPATGPWVEARGRAVRRGRTTLVVEATVGSVAGGLDGPDGDRPAGADVATATMTFAVLPARATATTSARIPTDGVVRWAFTGTGFPAPVADACGMSVVDPTAGEVHLPVATYVHNSFGAVQGGVMALLAEVAGLAALDAADPSSGPPVARELLVTYLALGRVGPVRSSARVLAASAGGGTATVELVDDGADGGPRLTTTATVVARPAPRGPR